MKVLKKLDLSDRRNLAKTISLVESEKNQDQQEGDLLIQELYDGLQQEIPQNTIVIAITGTPGAGKSTFINAFGTQLADQGFKVAVLAIDPSSSLSGGAILGDKTRMTELARHPNAFIRPTPSRVGSLGGLAPATEDSLYILKAAKFDYIFIETIGVGQNEWDVALLADRVIIMIPPMTGDELQGIKKGNLEYIDYLVINKFDGASKDLARATADDYQSAFKSLGKKVFLTSAVEKTGFEDILKEIQRHSPPCQHSEQLLLRRLDSQLLKTLLSIPSIAEIFNQTNKLKAPTRIKVNFFIEQLKKLLTRQQIL
ncbi:ArgK/MeaB family GTPase [Candidatus Odyssella acanthamoebae]|uniref:ArgK/MeaB family GTPase n=1 Tax=Candidatus Odyssella acanthamoebae TaxID=91604 RepID=UPI000689B7EB|nr:GTP-binding protein [Candidatus Paracaedibacter acanthamoebae]